MTVPGSNEAAAAMSNSSAQSALLKVISPVTSKSPLTSSLSQTETLRPSPGPSPADRLPTIMSVLKLPVSLEISARLVAGSGKAFQPLLNRIGFRQVSMSPLTSSLSQMETLRPSPADRLPTIMSVLKLPVSLEISARLVAGSGKACQDELNRIGFSSVSIRRVLFVIRILSKALVLMARGWLSVVPKKVLAGLVPLLPPSCHGIVIIPSLTEFRFARYRLRQLGK